MTEVGLHSLLMVCFVTVQFESRLRNVPQGVYMWEVIRQLMNAFFYTCTILNSTIWWFYQLCLFMLLRAPIENVLCFSID